MKKTIAWIILIILIVAILGITYVKFFMEGNKNFNETPATNETSEIITTALTQITENFNEYQKEKKRNNISAVLNINTNSIFISYGSESTITYELKYNNLNLEISIENNEENIKRYNEIEEGLINAIQKRLNNTEDISEKIKEYLNNEGTLNGITKEKKEKVIEITYNITKKISTSNEVTETNEETNLTETTNETNDKTNSSDNKDTVTNTNTDNNNDDNNVEPDNEEDIETDDDDEDE